MATSTFIALLRGINVGGHNRVPMAELRSLCESLGLHDVRTWIQSGNIVFRADSSADSSGSDVAPATAADLELQLERAILDRFDLAVTVVVRSADEWLRYLPANPFPDASERAPNRVMLLLSKRTPNGSAARTLQERAADGERVALAGTALWIHFPEGSGRSKIAAPSLLERVVGSPVTSRNWRTVVKLAGMIEA
jgi:uncharacterized protein (DUF1697 family)